MATPVIIARIKLPAHQVLVAIAAKMVEM